MKRKILSVLLVSVMAMCMLAACGGNDTDKDAAAAEDTSLEDLQEAGVMKVGMCPEYPPFESLTESGDIEGFDVDLANAIAEKLGVEAEFVNTPYEGLIAGLENGDFDIIMSGSKEDLEGKTVGSHAGSTSEYAVQSLADEGITVNSAPYNRHSEAFADLQNGNIDAQVVEDTWAEQKIKEADDIIMVEEPINSINMAGVIGSGKQEFTDAFNEAFAELQESGEYDEIVNKWFG